MFGIAGLVGDVVGSAWQAHQQRESAQRQREWSEGQASQRHQIAANDLRAAGFNPMLTGMNQQGAPMPQGTKADVPQTGQIGSRGMHSAQQFSQMRLQKQQRDINSAPVAEAQAKAKVWNKYGDLMAKESLAKGLPITQAKMLVDAARPPREDSGTAAKIDAAIKAHEKAKKLNPNKKPEVWKPQKRKLTPFQKWIRSKFKGAK